MSAETVFSESAAGDDPFALLGLPAEYPLSRALLEQRHRELSKALHPDRHRDQPAGARRLLLERAMRVNEAYRVLRDPVARAQALLALRGQPSALEAEPSPQFLLQVMDEREALAEAIARGDGEKLEALAEAVAARCAACEDALAAAFAGAEGAAELPALLAQLRYDARFLEQARAAADALI